MSTSEGCLLDPKALAKLLGISVRTIRNWVRQGHFPQPLRMGPRGRMIRWTPTQIMTYLKANREANAARTATSPTTGGKLVDEGPTERFGGTTGSSPAQLP
jgi:predicted DNA-binding transcriptional regulator AlpA